jgi:hypothetical protein
MWVCGEHNWIPALAGMTTAEIFVVYKHFGIHGFTLPAFSD